MSNNTSTPLADRILGPKELNFDEANDIFNRKPFGESLATLIQGQAAFSTQNPLAGGFVVALDSNWGEGKTVFIKQWENMLSDKKSSFHMPVMYFDAFAHDYHAEPLLPFIAQTNRFLSDELATGNATSGGNGLFKAATKDLFQIVTGGKLNNTVDELLKILGTDGECNQDSMQKFKHDVSGGIAKRAESCQDDKPAPLVIIIDELDRCNPIFAIKLLEVVKHLFSMSGIAFVLVTNRTQLEETIRRQYGCQNATLYLSKFINVWTALPKEGHEIGQFVQFLTHGSRIQYQLLSEILADFSKFHGLALREIGKVIILVDMVYGMFRNNSDHRHRFSKYMHTRTHEFFCIAAFLAIIATIKPDVISRLATDNITSTELLQATNLNFFLTTQKYDKINLQILKKTLEQYFEEKNKGVPNHMPVSYIIKILSQFKVD